MNDQKNNQSYSLPSDTNRKTPLYTATDMEKDLTFLKDKINTVTREAKSWDFYKISDIVNDKNELGVKIQSLIPGTSLIINTPTFNYYNQSFSKGDLVFKKNELEYVKIAAERGGTYYPYQITKESSSAYNFSFKFYNATIKEETTDVSSTIPKDTKKATWKVEIPTSQINFQGIGNSNESNTVYSIYQPLTATSTHFSFKSCQNITPNVKFYTSDNELIELNYHLEFSQKDTTWTVKFSAQSLVAYAVVK